MVVVVGGREGGGTVKGENERKSVGEGGMAVGRGGCGGQTPNCGRRKLCLE